ncbi:hypothetical protein G6F37_013024 [Rhizopus arrhizus]|nr:hypothetical protein G6F38_012967 [Rhizopus arrhizus]KAG1140192.1 hypothetical protein G6F37_013024 [Rhizopus arrhizus]
MDIIDLDFIRILNNPSPSIRTLNMVVRGPIHRPPPSQTMAVGDVVVDLQTGRSRVQWQESEIQPTPDVELERLHSEEFSIHAPEPSFLTSLPVASSFPTAPPSSLRSPAAESRHGESSSGGLTDVSDEPDYDLPPRPVGREFSFDFFRVSSVEDSQHNQGSSQTKLGSQSSAKRSRSFGSPEVRLLPTLYAPRAKRTKRSMKGKERE